MTELRKGLSPTEVSGRIEMRTPDEVSAMLALKACGWGSKRIAAELGCSRNTVKRWLAEGGWCAAKAQRCPRALDGLEAWLGERFRRHAGNADVVRQELAAELGITVSLRTVERAVAHLRQELRSLTPTTDAFACNAVRMLISIMAYQLMRIARRGMARATGTGWSLRRLRERVLRAGARLIISARRMP